MPAPRISQAAGPVFGARRIAPFFLLTLAACDLTVTNPGPVGDSDLNVDVALPALVNGAGRALGRSIGASEGSMGFTGTTLSHEFYPGGQTGSYGTPISITRGYVPYDEINGDWAPAHQARFLAEQAVQRARDVLGDVAFAKSATAALGLLYVGYANRHLGEHVCNAVFDGGPAESFLKHFERADAAFTEALAVAQAAGNTTYQNAALAGRASVRTWLGNWTGAEADAALVPAAFKFQLKYNNLERPQMNSYFYSVSITPFRTVTYWNTFSADNYETFNDPRTKYNKIPSYPYTQGALWDIGDGVSPLTKVPFYQQAKYPDWSSPIDLSDGREAALIVAEARLRAGDWAGAMTIINGIRTTVGVVTRTAADATEAWTWLKVEKAIELWIESRWLGEMRRWLGDGTDPAAPGPLPALLRLDNRPGQERCIPISKNEVDSNPNIP